MCVYKAFVLKNWWIAYAIKLLTRNWWEICLFWDADKRFWRQESSTLWCFSRGVVVRVEVPSMAISCAFTQRVVLFRVFPPADLWRWWQRWPVLWFRHKLDSASGFKTIWCFWRKNRHQFDRKPKFWYTHGTDPRPVSFLYWVVGPLCCGKLIWQCSTN